MRLITLGLDAFGPFTDVEIDLSGGAQGLHIIHGLNEAGKSTSLRALRQLFFGIPQQTNDNFLHEYENMKIRAVVRHSSGEELEFVRWKKRKNALTRPNGSAIDEATLQKFLGGIDKTTFEKRFTIHHEDLVRGGQELLTDGGEAGEVLFAAASGIRSLKSVQSSLQEELERYFKPRGEKPLINKALLELKESRELIKRLQVPSERFLELERDLEAMNGLRARLMAERRDVSRDKSRLERLRQSLTLVSERRDLIRALEELQSLPDLPLDFGEQWRRSHRSAEQAERDRERLDREIESLREQIEQIDLPEGLLKESASIERIQERWGAWRKAEEDRQLLVRDHRERQHGVREILRDLGRDPNLENLEFMRLRAGEEALIQGLGREFHGLTGRCEELDKACKRLRLKLGRIDRELESESIAPDPEPLRRAIEEAQELLLVEDGLEEARGAVEADQGRIQSGLRQLPGWSGSLEVLRDVVVPLEETIGRSEQRQRELSERLVRIDEQITAISQEIAALEAQVRALDLSQSVPTEEEMQSERRRRDAGWRRIRHNWLGEAVAGDDADVSSWPADHSELADAYGRSVEKADELADRMRREAAMVATKAEWLSRLEQLERDRLQVQESREELEAEQRKEVEDWGAKIEAMGIGPFGPSEMRAWARMRTSVLEQADRALAAVRELERNEQRVGRQRTRMRDVLKTYGETPDAEAGLRSLVDRTRPMLARLDKGAAAHEELRHLREETTRELETHENELQAAREAIESWRSRWAAALSRLELDPTATVEQIFEQVSRIKDLIKKKSDADHFASRIKGIDKDAEAFREDLAALLRRLAGDLADLPLAEAMDGLRRRFAEATKKQERLDQLRARMEADQIARDEVRELAKQARAELDRACGLAGARTVDELPGVEARLERRRQLQEHWSRCDEHLRTLSGGRTVDEFVREVEQEKPDEFDGRLAELEEREQAVQAKLDEIGPSLGKLQREREQIDGSDEAATKEGEAANLVAQLQTEIPRYVSLRLASMVLQRSIERFRERNQGPILERAGRLFCSLTAGSFTHLEVDDYDAKQNVVMVGVRPDRKRVLVEGMSEGTRDQLYLALRLALLEQWLDAHEPLPFVVDELLLNFDDPRAVSALKTLSELSKKTQVIFFTHHQHLVDLARRNLPEEVLFVHRLPVRNSVSA